jgi:thiamine pyrophosphate-dependent acetolactate synthase large subunit-like protein
MGRRIVELLVEGCRQIGIPYAFGVPGRAVMPVYNAFYDSAYPECILATHETAAAFMAATWATLRGVPGLILGTTGPGATNMVTGLATAFAEAVHDGQRAIG